MYSSFVVGLV